MGGAAWVNAPRSALLVGTPPGESARDTQERLVVVEKTNLAPFPPPAAIAFRLTPAPEDASRAVVEWLDERVGVTPEAMLADRREHREVGEVVAELILASVAVDGFVKAARVVIAG